MDPSTAFGSGALDRQQWAPDSFLGQVPPGCLQLLLAAADIVTFALNDVLIEEDAMDDDVFLLLESYVKVTRRSGRGEALLAVRGAGDVVGEMAAADGRSRLASVRACGRQQLVAAQLPGAMFWDVVSADRQAARMASAMVTRKLRAATRRRVDYLGASPVVRIARLVQELVDLYGMPIGASVVVGLDLTQVELGSFVGVTRPTAERALRELRLSGLVDTGGRRLIVLDQQGLQDVASEGMRPSGDGEGPS